MVRYCFERVFEDSREGSQIVHELRMSAIEVKKGDFLSRCLNGGSIYNTAFFQCLGFLKQGFR